MHFGIKKSQLAVQGLLEDQVKVETVIRVFFSFEQNEIE